MTSILELALWVCGLGVGWWYLQIWPFDGSTGLPKRKITPPVPKNISPPQT